MSEFNLGFASDFFFGKGPDKAYVSGAFPGIPQLGGALQKYLLDRLQTPAGESAQFKLGSQAIRDQLSGVSGAARQRLGEGSIAGGFSDSGSVGRGLGDIDRAELSAFSSSLRELLLGLEDRRTEGVLPFLSGGANENLGTQGLNIQAVLGERGQNIQAFSSVMEAFGSILGCWVARATYGDTNPKWLVFRHWLFTEAPDDLRDAYMRNGPALGRAIRRNPKLRATMKRVLDSIIGA